MTTQDLTLMQGLLKKMDWEDKRQKVLAENISNADTPNAKPMDLAQPDFKDVLQSTTSKRSLSSGVSAPLQMTSVGLATTNDKHMSLGGATASSASAKEKKQKDSYEVSPAGNAIVLEEQLLKMNENATEHRLISNLYQKNMEMLKMSVKSQ